MPTSKITNVQLKTILGRKGYGIQSTLGARAFNPAFGGKGQAGDVEPGSGYESLRAQAVSLSYTGKCTVRIKFFRKRLADYSRANCEKYIIDALVYAGAIRDDSENEIWLVDEGQVKVKTDAEQRVEVTLEYSDVDFDNLWVKREKIGNIGK